jgi:carbamoyl-phosphate synthase small subunit
LLKAIVALEDGKIFKGTSFGSPGESVGEVVFNTSMTGYQEILTDPSYSSQIVTMTYPLIGNYGINDADVESSCVQVRGLLVREACRYPSNFKSQKTLDAYLKENKIIGIEGIDTRALTRHIRLQGAMKTALWAGEGNPHPDDLVDKARAWGGLVGIDCVKDATCPKPYIWNPQKGQHEFHVAAIDFGIKYNILRILDALGCFITVFPASASAEDIKKINPDGIFLSNGPGDPAAVTYAIGTIQKLIGYKPVFGICLGHQLIALAIGAKTYKLKFGHRGANHPVRNTSTGAVEITSQNHGFCVDIESIPKNAASMTHINLNDRTCEGLEDRERQFFCVQYHPEASPGPHDSAYLFEKFIALMKEEKQKSSKT